MLTLRLCHNHELHATDGEWIVVSGIRYSVILFVTNGVKYKYPAPTFVQSHINRNARIDIAYGTCQRCMMMQADVEALVEESKYPRYE